MFICRKCVKRPIEDHESISHGKCESCGEIGECRDE